MYTNTLMFACMSNWIPKVVLGAHNICSVTEICPYHQQSEQIGKRVSTVDVSPLCYATFCDKQLMPRVGDTLVV